MQGAPERRRFNPEHEFNALLERHEAQRRRLLLLLWGQVPTILMLLGLIWEGRGVYDRIETNRIQIEELHQEIERQEDMLVGRVEQIFQLRTQQIADLRSEMVGVRQEAGAINRSTMIQDHRLTRIEERVNDIIGAVNRLSQASPLVIPPVPQIQRPSDPGMP